MIDPITFICNPIGQFARNAQVRRAAIYLFGCVLSLLALQVSVQAGEPLNEMASLKCVLVQAGEFQPDATAGIADVTICHRPLHDEAFPVMHGSEPGPDEFEVFNDMVEDTMPVGRPDWHQAMTLISFY